MASASVSLKNATDDFDEALSYALGAIGKKDLCLKDEQELAIGICTKGMMSSSGCRLVLAKVSVSNVFFFFSMLN